MVRPDGRAVNHLRSMGSEQGLLVRADGSARYNQGGTSVIAAVYGPRDVNSRKEQTDRATVETVWRPRTGLPGTADAEAERFMRSALEAVILTKQHPRTLISVVIQVVSEDGAVLACAINAACLALVDAGIPLSSLFGAANSALLDNQVLLDASGVEETSAQAVGTYVFTAGAKDPITIKATGMMPGETFFEMKDNAALAVDKVIAYARAALGSLPNHKS